jgi:hypothetical protein
MINTLFINFLKLYQIYLKFKNRTFLKESFKHLDLE